MQNRSISITNQVPRNSLDLNFHALSNSSIDYPTRTESFEDDPQVNYKFGKSLYPQAKMGSVKKEVTNCIAMPNSEALSTVYNRNGNAILMQIN